MKRSIAMGAAVMFALNGSTVFANGGGNSSSSSAAPAPVHHSASAPTMPAAVGAGIPRSNSGLPHNYSGSYRPLTVYGSGNRTLVYPSVRNSTIHPQVHSTLNNLSARSVRQNGGNVHSTTATVSNGKTKLAPQTSTRLRHWSGNASTPAQARQINANNHHHHHDHDWWRHHCLALIFFDWGWWGWYDGWWYPAWGYDPYSYYPYYEPIYGYGGLTPEQIVASVQVALQQLGYYTYAVDGKMGPITRAAIARYQRDQLLPITSGIDPATLGSLGIIR